METENTGLYPNKRAISSLINRALRSFDQPAAYEPNAVLREIVYWVNQDEQLRFNYKRARLDVMTVVNDHFKEMFKANSKAQWDTKTQKDHFVEVQHVVRLLALWTGPFANGGYAHATLVQCLHLSYYLNDRRNTWAIPGALNRRKGEILLAYYTGHSWEAITKSNDTSIAEAEFLRDYLFHFAREENNDAMTPFAALIDLAADMATCPMNDVTKLTVACGERVYEALVNAYVNWSVDHATKASKTDFATIITRRQKRKQQKDLGIIAEFCNEEHISTYA